MTGEQLIAKLIHGRAEAILLTDEARQTSRNSRPTRSALRSAYSTMPRYLAFTKDFGRRNPALVQQLWASIRAR